MMTNLFLNHLEKELDFLSDEDRRRVLDALYCEMHNTWAMAQGNHEDQDVEWFARWLADGFNNRGYSSLDDNEKRFWQMLAEQCIRGLPLLMGRMVSRYQTAKDMLHVLLEAQWVADKKAKEMTTTHDADSAKERNR